MDEAGNLSSTQGSYSILSLDETSHQQLTLFPNPSNGNLFIEGIERNEEIQIFDIHGKMMYQEIASYYKLELNLKLTKGLYFIQHKNNKTPFIIK